MRHFKPCVALVAVLACHCQPCWSAKRPASRRHERSAVDVYVSYAYFEKDDVQPANLDFFLRVGAGYAAHHFVRPKRTHINLIVAGDVCSPCHRIQPGLTSVPIPPSVPSVRKALVSEHAAVLYRKENSGMDFASHSVGLLWLAAASTLHQFRYFIFLNSSVRGPFVPAYMPPHWQWTDAFTGLLQRGHALAACSITCLPAVDLGGPGPRAESWAFALDRRGLDTALQSNVFAKRSCKLCDDGVVVGSEYGLSKAVLGAGLTMATLMTKYRPDVNWSNASHWHCNNNVHPSREQTYDGVSQHPLELVFVKSSWHVAQPYVDAYTKWALALADGRAGTEGTFDESMYRYAISEEAVQG